MIPSHTAAFQVPWFNGRYSPLTLWDVNAFLASRLLDISSYLFEINDALETAPQRPIKQALEGIVSHCSFMSLRVTGMLAEHCLADLNMFGRDWKTRLDQLESSFRIETQSISLFFMPPDKLNLYEAETPFGDVVDHKFNSARKDIREAVKCYAMDRHTACVFHLMRTLECGLRVMAIRLTGRIANPNWQQMLEGIENEIARRSAPKAKPPLWKSRREREFFHGAALHLRYLKDAWRNHACHAGTHFDGDDAEKIFTHTREFMQHLATKLKERRKTTTK